MINKRVELKNKIGKGAYGDVFLGRNIVTKETYAIKKITKKQLKSETIYQYFNNEIFILKHLNHPNIVKFKGLIEYKSDYYLLIEYCNGGSLERAMKYYMEKYNKPVPENIVRYFIKSILMGIFYLNQNNIIHRDIKSDNILLQYDDEHDMVSNNFLKAKIKIIDFGFARYLEQDELAGSLVGTPMYMEPSILKTFMTSKSRVVDGFYDKKVDVWSIGILTYELLIGIVPFVANDIRGLFHTVEERDFFIPKEEKRNFKLTEGAILFIDKTLNIDMNMRPLPEELIKDPWIMGKYNNCNNLYVMKKDKEILLVSRKTEFKNFWKLAKSEDKKKVGLEIIGISYISPIKKQILCNSSRGNNNNNNSIKINKDKNYTIKSFSGRQQKMKASEKRIKNSKYNSDCFSVTEEMNGEEESSTLKNPKLNSRVEMPYSTFYNNNNNSSYNQSGNYYTKVKINGQRYSYSKPKNIRSLNRMENGDKYKIDNRRKNHDYSLNKKMNSQIINNTAVPPKILRVKKLQLVKISLADENENNKKNENSTYSNFDKNRKKIKSHKSFDSSDDEEEEYKKGRTHYDYV